MASGDLKTYNGGEVTVDVGGILCQGLADGVFCKIAQASDDWSDYPSTDGEVARARTNDGRATVTISLAQTSSSNDALSALSNVDKRTGKGVVPIFIRDRNGRAIYKADKAWIMRGPEVELGRDIAGRDWMLRCAKLERIDGGN